jgi:hypothetical protein
MGRSDAGEELILTADCTGICRINDILANAREKGRSPPDDVSSNDLHTQRPQPKPSDMRLDRAPELVIANFALQNEKNRS